MYLQLNLANCETIKTKHFSFSGKIENFTIPKIHFGYERMSNFFHYGRFLQPLARIKSFIWMTQLYWKILHVQIQTIQLFFCSFRIKTLLKLKHHTESFPSSIKWWDINFVVSAGPFSNIFIQWIKQTTSMNPNRREFFRKVSETT